MANSKKNSGKNDDNQIVKRLDAIISVLIDKDKLEKSTMTGKIHYLTKLGFSNPDIARILMTSASSIEAQKYRKTGGKKR